MSRWGYLQGAYQGHATERKLRRNQEMLGELLDHNTSPPDEGEKRRLGEK